MFDNETGYRNSDLNNVSALIVNPRHKSYTEKGLIMTRQFCLPPLCWWATFTTPYLQQSASDNGTPGPRSPWLQLYLVHISVRAASYPLDQLEILLRIPPRQVDTGIHHVHCRSRRRARTTEKRQRYTKTGILRKNIRRQKIPARIQCSSNMASSLRWACALGSMA